MVDFVCATLACSLVSILWAIDHSTVRFLRPRARVVLLSKEQIKPTYGEELI